jgi:hypothetical protein
MHLRAALLLLIYVTTSCGEEAPNDRGPCAQRSGTYRMVLAERSGNCGSAETVETIDAQPSKPPPPCTAGEIRYSEDNCEVTNVNVTCPTTEGGTSVINGKYTWSKDGSSGAGTMAMTIGDNLGLVCQSSYDVTLERL